MLSAADPAILAKKMWDEKLGMTLNEYHKLAMRTKNPEISNEDGLLEGLMGLNGEAGEAIDVLKKSKFQGHQMEKEKMVGELGDCLWYIVRTADAMDISLEEVARFNIEKLRRRFPEGFTAEDSVKRVDVIDKLMNAVEDKLHEGNKHW